MRLTTASSANRRARSNGTEATWALHAHRAKAPGHRPIAQAPVWIGAPAPGASGSSGRADALEGACVLSSRGNGADPAQPPDLGGDLPTPRVRAVVGIEAALAAVFPQPELTAVVIAPAPDRAVASERADVIQGAPVLATGVGRAGGERDDRFELLGLEGDAVAFGFRIRDDHRIRCPAPPARDRAVAKQRAAVALCHGDGDGAADTDVPEGEGVVRAGHPTASSHHTGGRIGRAHGQRVVDPVRATGSGLTVRLAEGIESSPAPQRAVSPHGARVMAAGGDVPHPGYPGDVPGPLSGFSPAADRTVLFSPTPQGPVDAQRTGEPEAHGERREAVTGERARSAPCPGVGPTDRVGATAGTQPGERDPEPEPEPGEPERAAAAKRFSWRGFRRYPHAHNCIGTRARSRLNVHVQGGKSHPPSPRKSAVFRGSTPITWASRRCRKRRQFAVYRGFGPT